MDCCCLSEAIVLAEAFHVEDLSTLSSLLFARNSEETVQKKIMCRNDELEFGRRHGFSSMDCALGPTLSFIVQDAENDYARANKSLISKRAKVLKDLETEALMQQWDLDERDIQNSPQTLLGEFGSPIRLAFEELPVLASTGPGISSFVQKDITGKSIENMLWNATTSMAGPGKLELFFGWNSNFTQKELEEFGNDWRDSNFKLKI